MDDSRHKPKNRAQMVHNIGLALMAFTAHEMARISARALSGGGLGPYAEERSLVEQTVRSHAEKLMNELEEYFVDFRKESSAKSEDEEIRNLAHVVESVLRGFGAPNGDKFKVARIDVGVAGGPNGDKVDKVEKADYRPVVFSKTRLKQIIREELATARAHMDKNVAWTMDSTEQRVTCRLIGEEIAAKTRAA